MYYINFTLDLTLFTNFWVHQKRQTKKENDSSSAFFLSTLISTKLFYTEEREKISVDFWGEFWIFLNEFFFHESKWRRHNFRMRSANFTAVIIYDCATNFSRTFSNCVVVSMTIKVDDVLFLAQWIQNMEMHLFYATSLSDSIALHLLNYQLNDECDDSNENSC